MTNSPIAVIRSACIRANPKIRTHENRCLTCGYGFEYCRCTPKKTEWFRDREITLADVLLALREKFEKGNYGVAADGRFVYLTGDAGENYFNFFPDSKAETEISWDLKNDSLESQSPETLLFLSSLLGKE